MANVAYPVEGESSSIWLEVYLGSTFSPTYWNETLKIWDSELVDEFSFGFVFWTQYVGDVAGEVMGTVRGSPQNLPPLTGDQEYQLIVVAGPDEFMFGVGDVLQSQVIDLNVDTPINLPISPGQVLALAVYDSAQETPYSIINAYGPLQFVFAPLVDDPNPEVALKFTEESLAYELDRGWSFDGNYIPHFLELNWFFGEDPVTYKSVNKVRIHGLVKGTVNLEVSMSGMQGDVATDYIPDYTDPEYLDFPFTPIHVQSDFVPATNYVDYSDRGLALLMKFEGRNQDIALPEPSHVIQVLALQSSPQGNGKTAN